MAAACTCSVGCDCLQATMLIAVARSGLTDIHWYSTPPIISWIVVISVSDNSRESSRKGTCEFLLYDGGVYDVGESNSFSTYPGIDIVRV